MSRHRSISTDSSTDSRMAELAEHGPLPLVLDTWAMPHADDWGRMTGDPRQFKLLVCRGLDVTARDVEQALTHVPDVGGGIFDAEVLLQGGGSQWLRVTLALEYGPRLRTLVEPIHP
jgi:hypothetical protein